MTQTTPLLIAGAGIAGLWAALHAAPRPVILLTGARLGQGASTAWAQGGVAAALSEDDSPALHAADTIAAGAGLVDEAAARLLAEAGPAEVEALYALGAPFEREANGRWALSREAAHSTARVARIKGDQAGAGLLAALIKALRRADHIEVREGWRLAALLPDAQGACAGGRVNDPEGRAHRIKAHGVILATGSIGGLYKVTTTPPGALGQGIAMAARLGAAIQDPEFVQFHPTAIDAGQDPAPLATEALRGEGAYLIDRRGVRFMLGVHKDAELAPRDVVARAVHRARQGGRGAFLDARQAVGAAFPERFPAVFAACKAAGIDPRIQPIPIAPAAHYHMGGIKTDLNGFTGIAGLYAVGECASTGVHGANRLASNSLLEGLVFGRRAALAAREAEPVSGDPRTGEIPPALPAPALLRLRQAMAAHAGVERDEAGLSDLIGVINALEARYGAADPLIAARFIAEGTLARRESRGGHFRRDHPQPSAIAAHTRLRLEELRADLSERSPARAAADA